jgi:GNAT superfamily N-acetyltransferase
MELRPLRTSDVEGAIDLSAQAEWGPKDDVARARQRRRIEHLLGTDPGGAWLATDGDLGVVGLAMALRREGLWGLSLLMVDERCAGRGIGRGLTERALAYGADATMGLIVSSQHPAALRLYALAGFAIRPSVSLFGPVRHRPDRPTEVRDAEAFEPWMDEVAREVRGAGYGPDPAVWREIGQVLRCVEGRGWSAARGGRLSCVLARDEEAARWLLEAHLAEAPGGANVEVDFITAGQDWAIGIGLRAGLSLSPDGAVFTRGRLGTLHPWLPTGAYL